jgi:hypothetical protein
MEYPTIPANLKQASLEELARAHNALRQYKNVTVLGIRHWRAIPELKDRVKQVNADQRRIMREIKSRPHRVIMPSSESSTVVPPQSKLNIGERVHSKFHNADGEIVRIEYSSRVGAIYHVRLDSGNVAPVSRADLEA